MMYEVRGIQTSTGKHIKARIEADTPEAAIARAARHGVQVAAGAAPVLVSSEPPRAAATPRPSAAASEMPPTPAVKTQTQVVPVHSGNSRINREGDNGVGHERSRWSAGMVALVACGGAVVGAIFVGVPLWVRGGGTQAGLKNPESPLAEAPAAPPSGTRLDQDNADKDKSQGGTIPFTIAPDERDSLLARTDPVTTEVVKNTKPSQVQTVVKQFDSLPPVYPVNTPNNPIQIAFVEAKRALRIADGSEPVSQELRADLKARLLAAANAVLAQQTTESTDSPIRLSAIVAQRSILGEGLIGAWKEELTAKAPPQQARPKSPPGRAPREVPRPQKYPGDRTPKVPDRQLPAQRLIAAQEPTKPLMSVVRVDPQTGQWQVLFAIDNGPNNTPTLAGEGTEVELVGEKLKLKFKPTALKDPPFADGEQLQMFVAADGLSCRGSQRSVTLKPSTDKSHMRRAISFWSEQQSVALPQVTGIDPSDANSGWHEIASLMSFDISHDGAGWRERDMYKFFIATSKDFISPNDNGIREIHQRFANVATSKYTLYQQIAANGQSLFVARAALRDINNRYGNTPSGSLRMAMPAFSRALWSSIDYQLSRDQDIQDSGEFDAERSPESQEKLRTLMQNMSNILDFPNAIQRQAQLSRVLEEADIALAEHQVDLWRKSLVPLAAAAAGPPMEASPIDVTPNWRSMSSSDRKHKLLWSVKARNKNATPLSNVTIEMVVQNQFGDTFTHFYYIDEIQGDGEVDMALHPRWCIYSVWQMPQLIDSITAVEIQCRVWCDQGQFSLSVRSDNPEPSTDPAKSKENAMSIRNSASEAGKLLAEQALIDASVLVEKHRSTRSGANKKK